MIKQYRPKNFDLRELVHPYIYAVLGQRAWEQLDREALMMLQGCREKFGRIIVNDWHVGGSFENSGLRTHDSQIGAPLTLHKLGRAFDMHPRDVSPRYMFDYILAHQDEFPLLTTLENIDFTPTWLHADNRNHNQLGIWVVNP